LQRAGIRKQQINPPSVFRSLDHGFPQAVATTGKRLLYVSGQTAWDVHRNLVGGSDLAAQARQAFSNLRKVVEAGGATLSDVVSLRIYECFPGDAAPATTWPGVAALADPGFLIEVEATAVFD
jgi:2-iminobutanoate/2-iminopropanoate deaminase